MNFLRHLAPNIVTAAALVCGIAGIHAAVTGDPVDGTWWVLLGVVLDKADGAIARKLKAASALGAQFDSFSDFTTFGLAPFFIFASAFGTAANAGTVALGLIFVFGCVLRLSRFNIGGGSTSFFQGVPSPMAAGICCLILNVSLTRSVDVPAHALVFAGVLAGFGILMNLPWLTYQKIGREKNFVIKVLTHGGFVIGVILVIVRAYPEFLLLLSSSALLSGPLLQPFADRQTSESG